MELNNAIALPQFPFFYVLDIESESPKLWVYRPAEQDKEEIDREVIPKDGVVSMKDKEKALKFFKLDDIITNVRKALEEKRLKKEAIQRRPKPESNLKPDLVMKRNVLRMNRIDLYNKMKDADYDKFKRIKPHYEKALQELQEFDEDYPEYAPGGLKKKKTYDDDEMQEIKSLQDDWNKGLQLVLDAQKELKELKIELAKRFDLNRII